MKEDLEKSVKNSFNQAVKARDYLNSEANPKVYASQDSFLEIDMDQVTDIFLLSVTAGFYQNFITRLANINKTLNLISNNQYPWAINIFDLEIVTELIDSPAMFIHYTKRRLSIEQTNFDLSADEVDILGFYFDQGLYFETDEFKKFSHVSLSGFSEDIDRYFFEKYELGHAEIKPQQGMPEGFEELLEGIEELDSAYKTDCIIRLLDLNYKTRELFVKAVEQVKGKTRSDKQLHSFSSVVEKGDVGFAFIAMDAKGNISELFNQLAAFSMVKKYFTKCTEWVGFGWDVNSKRLVDTVFFVSFEWFEDPELEKRAKGYLKPGLTIDGPM